MENKFFAMPRCKRPMILGTDWHTDCDDAAAIRILARAHRNGVIRLCGVSVDSAMACSVASMRRFLCHEGIGEVPVGLDHTAFDYGGEAKYQPALCVGRDVRKENDLCEESLRLYRRLLADATERTDLIEIGFCQVLAALLRSGPDEFSPLNGTDLVSEKVGTLWMMGGRWDGIPMREFNFTKTAKATESIAAVLRLCPVKTVFLGFEVGKTVISGSTLTKKIPGDMLAGIFRDFGAENGRSSWDPMTAYLACIRDPETAGFRLVSGTAAIDVQTGYTSFTQHSDGKHAFAVKTLPDAVYERYLDEILLSD